ncbi:YheV family putative zinc ribbon protein, partial [Litorivivens sp.]
MSTEYRPRRFIAGAVCPKCAEMDKTVMYRVSDTEQVRECVRCGFKETIRDDGAPEEVQTRVNQPRIGEKPLAHEDEVQVVNLLDPK